MFQCLYNLTDLAHLIACFDWFSELDRVFCTNIIIYLFTVNKKVLHSIRQRKLIKVNQRKENHKSVQKFKYFFFIYIDVLLKSKNYHVEKSNKAYLMNICFAKPSRTILSDSIFALKSASHAICYSWESI